VTENNLRTLLRVAGLILMFFGIWSVFDGKASQRGYRIEGSSGRL